MGFEWLVLIIFPVLMGFAGATDLLTMRISNRVQVLLVITFFATAFLVGMGVEAFIWHVAAAFIVLLIGFSFFAFGWIGGGDAKLMAATTLWFGFSLETIEYLLIGTIYGGLLTVLILSMRSYPLPVVLASQGWIARLHDKKSGIPYGIALAAAALVVFPKTSLFVAAIG